MKNLVVFPLASEDAWQLMFVPCPGFNVICYPIKNALWAFPHYDYWYVDSTTCQVVIWILIEIKHHCERLLLNYERCCDSWPPEGNSIQGQRQGLITQSFCVIKFYECIKEIEKASDIDIRRGQKEYPPSDNFKWCLQNPDTLYCRNTPIALNRLNLYSLCSTQNLCSCVCVCVCVCARTFSRVDFSTP